MNKYFVLRKTNRMRTELLTEKSQEQLKEVIRYLRRVSWDFCGIELLVCCTAVFLFWVGRGRLAALSGNWKLGF